MSKTIFLLIILIVTLSVVADASIDATELAYRQGWDAGVVVVINHDMRKYGTGWFIDPEYIVTAYHVVDNGLNIEVVKGSFKTRASIVAFDEERDVAILRLERAYDNAHVFPLTTQIQKAGTIYIVGYPYELALLQGYNWAKISMNPRAAAGTASWYDSQRLLLELGTYTDSGNSGGPVLDDLGRAVGLVTFAIKGVSATMYFATTSHAIVELASKNGIPYKRDESQAQEQFAVISVNTNDPAIAFALVGFGAIVSVLTTIIVARRR